MVNGPVGQSGEHVDLTVSETELEVVLHHPLCLEVRIVLEMILRLILHHVMGTSVAQVLKLEVCHMIV